jgi:proline dehydrogenase
MQARILSCVIEDPIDPDLRHEAAESMRRLALDEKAKHAFMTDPNLRAISKKIASRYIGGESLDDALAVLPAIWARGHAASIDYMGESARDEKLANSECDVFADLIARIRQSSANCSVSLDLSHIGLVVDPELGLQNAVRLAEASEVAGVELMISAEGSDRADLILDTHRRLCEMYSHIGITVQARLHRTSDDLIELIQRPGRIRLVKGAFFEPESTAYRREDIELRQAYLRYAHTLIDAGHLTSIATHDQQILQDLRASRKVELDAGHVEFEMLRGLGGQTLDDLKSSGLHTREYVVFGSQWWLYVLNRIAEEPERIYTAVIDAMR